MRATDGMRLGLVAWVGCAVDPHVVVVEAETGVAASGDVAGESSLGSQGSSGLLLDVGGGPAATAGGCDETSQTGDYDFSLIWIANSAEGTVSKIDTRTATELARYRTGPGDTSPSRTSVNLVGDVAIGNRSGSVTKIAAREAACVDANGDGVIQSSTGPNDVLAWGADECVLWHQTVPYDPALGDGAGMRAVAWDASGDVCTFRPARLWVGWLNIATDTVMMRRLQGDTGELDVELAVSDWGDPQNWGIYGAAVNKDGDVWAIGKANAALIHIDGETLEISRYANPSGEAFYGLTLDAEGTPWVTGANGNDKIWHFDPVGEVFEDLGGTGHVDLRGLAIDSDGIAWIAANLPCEMVAYDTDSRTLLDAAIPLEGCAIPVGVSIDVDEAIWVVDRMANRAYKIDPVEMTAVTVEGLNDPYTYSDMTGAGLNLVVNPPIG